MTQIKCYGCGAVIQTTDPESIGYTPESALSRDHVLCQRCFQMKNYHKLTKTQMTRNDYFAILEEISNKDNLYIYLIDLFDFNGSLISGLNRHLNSENILIVGNKRDVLPKSIKDQKIEHWLRRQLNSEGLKYLDVILSSGKTNYHLDELIDKINRYRLGKNVYVIGVTNVGKSSLINALLKHYANENNHLITTSEFPGTTLGIIEIQLDEKSSLYDTPGIVNEHQMANQLALDDLNAIVPKGELRPMNFQINSDQTLYFGGLARVDYFQGEKTPFVCYFPRDIKIHRTKTANAKRVYQNDATLSPKIAGIDDVEQMQSYTFNLDGTKQDIVISGLGFFTVSQKNGKVKIMVPKGIGVFVREALI